jgi:hypothetical protein
MQLTKNEKVKDVEGYEGFYAVTSLGRIWSYRSNRFIKTWVDCSGYMRVTFCVNGEENQQSMHRLVGFAFVVNPDNKPQINHKNGDKKDCKASNLEWVTPRENLQHACDMGLNSCHKLSYQDKLLICQLYSVLKVRQNKIALMFNVSPPAIHYIIHTYTPIFAANHSL